MNGTLKIKTKTPLGCLGRVGADIQGAREKIALSQGENE